MVTICASIWLVYAANDAARDHRAAVEATYRDYTGMAARELARLSGESVHWLLDEAFDDVEQRVAEMDELGISTAVLSLVGGMDYDRLIDAETWAFIRKTAESYPEDAVDL